MSKAAEAGKSVTFSEAGCQILDADRKLIAVGNRAGNLYYLECRIDCQQANAAVNTIQRTKEDIWLRRFGHLGARNLQKLAKDKLVAGFDYDASMKYSFCESCVKGKYRRRQLPTNGGERSKELLGLVHIDLCGKIKLSGAEYFITLIDDKTCYMWTYVLKRKDQVFERFLEWNALVEKTTGRKLKVFRTDNGGEYTSIKFEKSEVRRSST